MSAQAVLFDPPGPKARRRHAILTVLGLLLAAMVGLSAGAPPATAHTKWLCKPGLAENPCAESIATVSVRRWVRAWASARFSAR